MKRLFFSLIFFVIVSSSLIYGDTISISPYYDLQVNVLESTNEKTVIEYHIGSFQRQKILIDNEEYYRIMLNEEPVMMNKGEPQLPYINRSIIVPDRARKEVVFIGGEYKEYSMDAAPSKGSLYRTQNPHDIPYQFDAKTYDNDQFYPAKMVGLSDPFIQRDFRGQTVSVYPFQYNPVSGILRVYKTMRVEVVNVGDCNVNIFERRRSALAREFIPIYETRFLNFSRHRYRYPILEEAGRMIVICNDSYLSDIQPYVDWKIQKGINTELYPVSEIGTTPGEIKSFLQQQYDLDDGLTFVQLVGNDYHIPSFRVRDGAADPVYSLLAGDDDYPDIFIGRFSAQNRSQVATQVERVLNYEKNIRGQNDWPVKATGIASGEGSDPPDIDHINAIRQGLLSYNYNYVDQIYAPGANSSRVTEAVNEGRGLINYAGHGNYNSWSTTGFNNSAVNNLNNVHKLPLIISVACQNANFIEYTNSFAETWVRATESGSGRPTGAIAFYGSSVNQLWYEPMTAQTEANNLLINEAMTTIGGLLFNASSSMIERFGSIGADEFKNWHILGDVSLQFRSDIPEDVMVLRAPEVFVESTEYEVETDAPGALVAISYDGHLLASGYTNEDGNIFFQDVGFPLEPATVSLTVTAYNRVTYTGSIEVIPNEGPYVIVNDYNIAGQGQNGCVEYGSLASINVSLKNVGTEETENIDAYLTTDDRYVTLIDSLIAFGDIEPDEIVSIDEAFLVQIADNIPNRHLVLMELNVTGEEEDAWLWRLNFRVHAPEFKSIPLIIDDYNYGNDNGILDPGERATIKTPIRNTGKASSPPVNVSIVSGDPLLNIEGETSLDIGPIESGATVYPNFQIIAHEDIPVGSIFPIGVAITSEKYSAQETHQVAVGPVTERFETGDFSSFDWQFTGNEPWVIDSDRSYRGNYSARSGEISAAQSSEMKITLDVNSPGRIVFHYLVSSEKDHDWFKFYINGYEVGRWSGIQNEWAQAVYPVGSGETIFKWVYEKDILIDHGEDCVWIDNIIFPLSGSAFEGPMILVYPTSVDFGTIEVGTTKEIIFHLRNFGNEDLTGTIEVYDGLKIIDSISQDIAGQVNNDSKFIYNYSVPPESNIPLKLAVMAKEERDYSGNVVITSNDENNPETVINVNAAGAFVSVEDEVAVPLTTKLNKNYPNPFNPQTTISYVLQQKKHVTIDVYNILGQKIITLVDEEKNPGRHQVVWDGSNDKGSKVASGIYLYRMITPEYRESKKMLYLK